MDEKEEKKMKFTARNDYAFKKLFGTEENKDILIDFLSFVTEINKDEFQDVALQNNELTPKFYKGKAGRLDIKITIKNGKKINLEMQNVYFSYYPRRSIFYWCELFIEAFKQGDDYSTLNKCIAINILNEPFPFTEKLHAVYEILEREEYSVLDDVFEIHFLDLTKLGETERSGLENWLLFIKTDDKNVREKLAKENPMIAKANNVMNSFYSNEREREAYLEALRYESDKVSMLNESERRGMAKGREEGREEGEKKARIEMAKIMKEKKFDIKMIMEMTGLSIEEIKKL